MKEDAENTNLKLPNILEEVDSLISEIEILEKDSLKINKQVDQNEEELLATVEKQIQRNTSSVDSKIILKVSEDKMHLFISYYPSKNGGSLLTKNSVIEALNEENITDHLGIKWNTVEQSINIVNSTERQIVNEEISCGIPPINKIPSYIILKDELFQKLEFSDSQDSIDYKTFSRFITVEKDDEIAEVTKEVRGFPGFDIYGNKIPFATEKTDLWKIGKNVVITENKLIATIYGSLKIEDKIISIENVLMIPENVDYNTGNIDFKGDVRIKGFIQDDFKVVSHGRILCENNVYGAFVRCSNSMEIAGGIIGRNKGKIACGGDLKVKFIENAFISCTKNMFISREIIHTNIYCSGFIKMSQKGKIVGSEIFAQDGIETKQIGNRAETSVQISLGIDYIIQKKLEKISYIQNQLSQKETTLSSKLNSELNPEKKTKLSNELQTVLDYRNKIISVMGNLLNNLEQNDNAKLIVRGDIYPGVFIEICHVCFKVTQLMSNVVFYLNKKTGDIEFKKNN